MILPSFPPKSLSVIRSAQKFFNFLRAVGVVWVLTVSSAGSGDQKSVPFSIGNPSDEEQLLIELVNRTRSNPPAEAARFVQSYDPDARQSLGYFGVDTKLMQQEFSKFGPQPPLVPNEKLSRSASRHSRDMKEHSYQGHRASDGAGIYDRIVRQGYEPIGWGENVYTDAKSVDHGHAGLTVSWGLGLGGMQEGRHHRANILSPLHNEIGVGVIPGNKGDDSRVITQVFAAAPSSQAFVTGVAYQDANGNGEYDLGEGVGGIRIEADGTPFHAVTADAGGYAIPVFEDRRYDVTISFAGSVDQAVSVEVRNGSNVKLDFSVDKLPPVIRGPALAEVGVDHRYTFSRIPGAASYDLRRSELVTGDWREGAEDNDPSRIRQKTSASYQLRRRGSAATGSKSFHLTFPEWKDQSFEIDRTLRVTALSALKFKTRFMRASSNSTLYAQVSIDDGVSWQSVWQRAGNETSGDSAFIPVAIPLADFQKQALRLRFNFRHHDRAYVGLHPSLGVLIDDVEVTASSVVENSTVTTLPGDASQFSFRPSLHSTYLLEVRANLPAPLPFGDALKVSAQSIPQLKTIAITRAQDRGLQLVFSVPAELQAKRLTLERSDSLGQPWMTDSEARLTRMDSKGIFRFDSQVSGSKSEEYYRIKIGTATP